MDRNGQMLIGLLLFQWRNERLEPELCGEKGWWDFFPKCTSYCSTGITKGDTWKRKRSGSCFWGCCDYKGHDAGWSYRCDGVRAFSFPHNAVHELTNDHVLDFVMHMTEDQLHQLCLSDVHDRVEADHVKMGVIPIVVKSTLRYVDQSRGKDF